jgi:hypothetical protein
MARDPHLEHGGNTSHVAADGGYGCVVAQRRKAFGPPGGFRVQPICRVGIPHIREVSVVTMGQDAQWLHPYNTRNGS